MIYGHVPPQATDTEAAVIGAMLMEKEQQDVVFGLISKPEVFYHEAHRVVYEAMQHLYLNGSPVDALTVMEELRRRGNLDIAGGPAALTDLSMGVISSAHVEVHARIVLEKHMSRELIRVGSEAVGMAYEDTTDVFDLLDHVSNGLTSITGEVVRNEPVPLSRGMMSTMREIEEQSRSEKLYTGVTTGFKELDEKTSGWQKSDVIILAARPSVGKTAFAINLAINAAKSINGDKDAKIVAIFSLEMGERQIHRRMLSCVSGVEGSQISNPNRLTAEEKMRLSAASTELAKMKIFIDDTAGLNHIQLRAKTRKLKQKYGRLDLVLIDYLQLMENVDKGLNREQQVSQNSRKIKILAKDLEVPIIALSQLNRSIENEKNRTPNLSDLRESGAIEQDADIVMFLSNPPATIVAKYPIYAGKILLNIAKGRNVGLGEMPLEFNKELQRWSDVDRHILKLGTAYPDAPVYGDHNNNRGMQERAYQNLNNSAPGPFGHEEMPF